MKLTNRIIGVLVLMSLVLGAFAVGLGAAEKGKPQEYCPVMGGKINRDIYVDYQGKRIYFCCPACPPEFRKDPEKYLKKLEEQGVELEKAPNAG